MPKRSEYTAGLRALADLLDKNPTIPLPYDGSAAERRVTIFCESRDEVADFAPGMPGALHKGFLADRYYDFGLTGRLGGLFVEAVARRDQVCERVVVGTRLVTRQVPDPDAPTVEVTETIEDVEWVCRPILAEPA